MEKYHVYGIGNALVDEEVEVSDDFLNKFEIEKGTMTLVEEDRLLDLHKELGGHSRRACGGSAANTVIAVSQFGGKSYYSCKVANDDMGAFYKDNLAENGVFSNLDKGLESGTTGKCLVMVTPDAERTMNTFLGITTNFSDKELREEEIAKSEYLYIEGYLVASPTGKAAAIKARKFAESKGVKTSLTLSDPNMVEFFKEGLLEMAGDKVDLLFCNEHEAKLFTGKEDLDQVKEELKKYCDSFAITLGAKGSLLYDGKEFISIPTEPIKAVDSNGAGDMYAGAFLYMITHGHSFAEAGTFASKAAAKVVSQFGPRLSLKEAKELQ